jgi:hypothetical protein
VPLSAESAAHARRELEQPQVLSLTGTALLARKEEMRAATHSGQSKSQRSDIAASASESKVSSLACRARVNLPRPSATFSAAGKCTTKALPSFGQLSNLVQRGLLPNSPFKRTRSGRQRKASAWRLAASSRPGLTLPAYAGRLTLR